MPTPVRIRGHLTGWTGYGQIAEWLGRGLEALGFAVDYEDYGADLRWLPQQDFVRDRLTDAPPPGWVVHLASPQHPFEGQYPTLFFTMWEATDIPAASVPLLNRAEAVLVPSSFNLIHFRRCGVTAPMHVVPLGVDPAEGYTPAPVPDGGPTVFGMAARLSGGGGQRKGLNEGAWAFADAFPRGDEAAELRIKIWPDDRKHLDLPDDPRIAVDTTPMLPAQMAAWTQSLTAYLCPSRGEGWGLHTHQAMACGRPVLAARWGGTAEFFDGTCGWELAHDEVPASGYYRGFGRWAAVRHAAMVEALRDAHADRGRCQMLGANAAARAARFTWARTARAVANLLRGDVD